MASSEELFQAIQRGDGGRVEAILDAQPDLLNARNDQGDSLLLCAAYLGRSPISGTILRRGAPVSVFEAAALGLADRVREHLDRDPALAAAYSHDGWTALHLAAFFGHVDTARLLLERGVSIDARSRNERFGKTSTPLHAACANQQTRVAELLIDRGADVNARDGTGYTPLALAANNRNDLLVVVLLEKGARVV